MQRAYDQIIHDIALQKLPVVLAIDRAGLVGEDGPTHHGAFDLSYLRCVPNMVIAAPKDEAELRNLLYTAIKWDKGPFAIRYPRGAVVESLSETPPKAAFEEIEVGSWEVLKRGEKVALLAVGIAVSWALEAAKIVEEKTGKTPAVVNARFVKPLDADLLKEIAKTHDVIITIEENTIVGGFGSAVLEELNKEGLINTLKVVNLGLPDEFVEHGNQNLLRERVGLSPGRIAERVLEYL
jgi:1-deoxy-D-xylulose-5-phosphate synthase